MWVGCQLHFGAGGDNDCVRIALLGQGVGATLGRLLRPLGPLQCGDRLPREQQCGRPVAALQRHAPGQCRLESVGGAIDMQVGHFAGFYLTGRSIGQRSDLELQQSVRQVERDDVVEAELVTCPSDLAVDLDAAGIAGCFCHRPPGDDAAPLQKQIQSHLRMGGLCQPVVDGVRVRPRILGRALNSRWNRPHPSRCNLRESR